MIAIPTAGTGSQTAGTAIFDLFGDEGENGIAHRAAPSLGTLPANTRTMPKMVAACSGWMSFHMPGIPYRSAL
jgi:alcohol dehydrogenase class IV